MDAAAGRTSGGPVGHGWRDVDPYSVTAVSRIIDELGRQSPDFWSMPIRQVHELEMSDDPVAAIWATTCFVMRQEPDMDEIREFVRGCGRVSTPDLLMATIMVMSFVRRWQEHHVSNHARAFVRELLLECVRRLERAGAMAVASMRHRYRHNWLRAIGRAARSSAAHGQLWPSVDALMRRLDRLCSRALVLRGYRFGEYRLIGTLMNEGMSIRRADPVERVRFFLAHFVGTMYMTEEERWGMTRFYTRSVSIEQWARDIMMEVIWDDGAEEEQLAAHA